MFLPDILKTITEKCSVSVQFLELLVVDNRPPHHLPTGPQRAQFVNPELGSEERSFSPLQGPLNPLVRQAPAKASYQYYRTQCWWMCSCGKMCCSKWHPRNNTPQIGNPQRTLTSDVAQWTCKARMMRNTSPLPSYPPPRLTPLELRRNHRYLLPKTLSPNSQTHARDKG